MDNYAVESICQGTMTVIDQQKNHQWQKDDINEKKQVDTRNTDPLFNRESLPPTKYLSVQ